MSRVRFAGDARRATTRAPRTFSRSRRNVVSPPQAERLEGRTLLAAFVVTDPGDSGPGTLRQAILDANTLTGPDTITFNLPGPDAVRTIRPLSPLPEITGQTSIDGRTQAGVVVELDGSLAGLGANGLTVSGSNSLIRGLVINRFDRHGIALTPAIVNGRPGPVPTGIRVELNLIGTDWTGNVDLGNGGAGVMVAANATVIGSQSPSTNGHNVISGNGFAGIWVTAAPSSNLFTGPTINGNYIGTNAGGNRMLGNSREGILIEAGTSGTRIGNTFRTLRNVISGNASSGIRLNSVTSPLGNVMIQNNYIGTDFAGAGALPNGWSAALPFHDGITVSLSSGNVTIGGPQPSSPDSSPRNVISGNVGSGVRVEAASDAFMVGNFIGTDATGNAAVGNGADGITVSNNGFSLINSSVQGNLVSGNRGDGVHVGLGGWVNRFGGNYIGTNGTGTSALGNRGNGVTLDGVFQAMQVGSQGPVPVQAPGALINPAGTTRNLISANGGHGIFLTPGSRTSTPPTRTLVNNYVGTDVTGSVPLGNGGSGLYIVGGNVVVGGSAPPSANVGNIISANGGNGITIVGATALNSPTGTNRVEGNRIGAAAVGTPIPPGPQPDPGTNAGLGNAQNGIAIFYSSNNRIGTGTASSGNVIAYNGGNGILVEGTASPSPSPISSASTGNLITANSIYGNGGLGIDLSLGGEGVTPNDVRDADTGPNMLQNYPTITEAVPSPTGTSIQIRYTLLTAPGSYRVEFFSSPFPDPSGYGEGRNYLGFVTVGTDANGAASGTFTAPVPNAGALYYTATATQSTGTGGNSSEFSPAVHAGPALPPPTPQDLTTVTQRHVFYNNSVFDENNPAADMQDGRAIAPDKQALLPGMVGSFENVTSYGKGINGIQIMFFGLGARPVLTADDFDLRMGTDGNPDTWPAAPAPSGITLIPVPGPNTVYDVVWPDGAIRNTWFRVTIKANANTGLASPDVFFFGNLVGEIGDGDAKTRAMPRVTAIDLAGTKGHFTDDAPITNPYDFNRDGAVNALDLAAVRANYGNSLPVLAVPIPVATTDPTAEANTEEPITVQVLG